MLPTSDAAAEPELRDYLLVLRRRRATVAVVVVLVVVASIVASFLTKPNYAATVKLLLRPRTTQILFAEGAQRTADAARSLQTEIEVIRTDRVRDRVRAQIGSAPPVEVRPIGQTDLVAIRAESTDPERAALVANAYATAYTELRRQQAIDDLAAGTEGVQQKIADLQRQIDDLASQLDAAPPCPDPRANTASCNQRSNIEQSVGLRRTTLLNQQAVFRAKLDEMQVNATLANGGVEVIAPATTPSAPFEPNPRRSALLGLMLGLLAGVGVAFLSEYLDDSIKNKEDLQRAVPGLPVLGIVPLVSDWKAKNEERVVAITQPNSSGAEAYRILRTGIQFLGIDAKVRVLQVTSPSPQEGKTTTLANLAVAFAAAGLRTIVVDCDLRRPRLHQFYGLDNAVGFTSVLLGSAGLARALQSVPDQDRLLFLASGPIPPNPSELLSSRRTADVLANLGTQADMVLIDSPPCLPVTDALVLSQRVDATIVVTTARATSRRAVAQALEMLQQVGAPLTGVVLNGATPEGKYERYRPGYLTQAPDSAPDGKDPARQSRSRRSRARASL